MMLFLSPLWLCVQTAGILSCLIVHVQSAAFTGRGKLLKGPKNNGEG